MARICCVHAPTGRPLRTHSENDFEAQHRYYEPHYAFDISLLICNLYIWINIFTTYTNNVCTTFEPIVQEYRECDVRRVRDNELCVQQTVLNKFHISRLYNLSRACVFEKFAYSWCLGGMGSEKTICFLLK